jgi:elongation factor P
MQVSTAEFRKGLKIELDGQPYNIVEFQHVKPGKGGAFVRTKLKHLRLGRVVDRTFRAGEKVGLVDYEQRSMQYLYRDDNYHFMNLDTYEQVALAPDVVGEAANWLKETMEVDVLLINGEPAGVEVPNFVELQVVKTDPGLRGDTASGGSKPATLETGAVVQVPLFIGVGERIRVDTRSDTYLERAK